MDYLGFNEYYHDYRINCACLFLLLTTTDFHLQTLNTFILHILGKSITIVLLISRTSHKFYCSEYKLFL